MTKSATQIIARLSGSKSRASATDVGLVIRHCAVQQYSMPVDDVRALIKTVVYWFKDACLKAGYDRKKVTALTTKFRDAGRRSAPWKATSSKVPGLPQDGDDGNRKDRWLLPKDHKFYSSEINATLVEVKYLLQAMSMDGAPISKLFDIGDLFTPWLVEHSVAPGQYIDPVQLIQIEFSDFIATPRNVQSGHLNPLDRGGRHLPDNTFLMLSRSNQLQGNLKVSELLSLMKRIVAEHDKNEIQGSRLEELIREQAV